MLHFFVPDLSLSPALSFGDVLLEPQRSKISSRSQISLKTHLTPKFEINFPLISIIMDCVTGVDMAIAMAKYGGISFYPRFAPPSVQAAEVKKIIDQGFPVVPAVGIKPTEDERVDLLVAAGAKIITVDVAHGHQESCLDFVRYVKKKYPEIEIIAGVVGTYLGTRDLFLAGADAVRIGVGPGSICTTRIITGSGVPQITALLSAYRAAEEFQRPIIADGGTRNSGDEVKALAAGANAVVIGSQLAGSDECPVEIIKINGKDYKPYNASTSKTEKEKQFSENKTDKSANYINQVEGIESFVPCRGPVANILSQLENGLRSGLSYSGAQNIEELHQKARFIQVTPTVTFENQNRGVTQL